MSLAPDEIREMTVADRLKLLDEIWESLLDEPGALPLSEAQGRAIDARLEAYRLHGDQGVTWEELDRRLQAD